MENKRITILDEDADGVFADDGIYYTWEEIELDFENKNQATVLPKPQPKIIKFKCKPTFNFQSIEFEIECSEDYLDPMFNLYRKIVEGLIRVSPDQPKNGITQKPASEKQLEIMDKFHIPYQPGISYDQADQKIQESYRRSREKSKSY